MRGERGGEERERKEEVVSGVFPDIDREVVRSILEAKNGDVDQAIESLLDIMI